jgi:hypothetical protein
MEEITKRFEIVRLAVELGDARTIEIQCDALRSLSLNDRLDEIIDLLESRNYRQALYEMKHYSEKVKDEFFTEETKRPRPSGRRSRTAEPAEPGLFDLEAVSGTNRGEERVLDVEDLLRLSRENRRPVVKEYVPAPTFDLEPEEAPEASGASESPKSQEEPPVLTESSPEEGAESGEIANRRKEIEAGVAEDLSTGGMQEPAAEGPGETPAEEAAEGEEQGAERGAPAAPSHSEHETTDEKRGERHYTPIPYIGQKFRNMIHQFPPVEEAEGIPEEVEAMQKKIARQGYSESEIEAFLAHYRRYKEEGRRGEAALVLLLAAATESQFAQFLLARELFKGEVIEEDHAEAFTQINTLADQNFPEAICDLAQFYEHGVGIGRDRQLALLLYEEAAEMGVARAARHYRRLKDSRGIKGLLGKVKLPDLSLKLPKKS